MRSRSLILVATVTGAMAVASVDLRLLHAQQPVAPPTPPAPGQVAGGRGGPGGQMAAWDFNDHTGFTQIFDGKTTTGWEGAAEVWKVVDGAIVAENTPEKPVGGTTFIFYKDTEIGDFELKLELKVDGGGNSGIQYRSRNAMPDPNFGGGRGGGARPGGPGGGAPGAAGVAPPAGGAAAVPPPAQIPVPPPQAAAAPSPNADPCAPGARGGGRGPGGAPGGTPGTAPGGPPGGAAPGGGQRPGGPGGGGPLGGPYSKWNLQGYQFDTDPNGCSVGQLFEGGRFIGERGITTRQGQVVLLREGQPNLLLGTIPFDEIRSTFKRGDYNQYHLIVRGSTFLHIINGKLASVTVDDDASKRQQKGVIGIQIEGPRVVAFKNVWLKKM